MLQLLAEKFYESIPERLEQIIIDKGEGTQYQLENDYKNCGIHLHGTTLLLVVNPQHLITISNYNLFNQADVYIVSAPDDKMIMNIDLMSLSRTARLMNSQFEL